MLCFTVEGIASFGEEDLTAGTRSIQNQGAQRMIAGAHLAFSFIISLEHKMVLSEVSVYGFLPRLT